MNQVTNSSVNEEELPGNEKMKHQEWEWRRYDGFTLKGEGWTLEVCLFWLEEEE